MVVYNEKLDDVSLHYIKSSTFTNLWKQPPLKVTEFFVDVFIRKVDSKQYNRSLDKYALLNASQQLGVNISKNTLYEYFPPDEFHDIKLKIQSLYQ